MFKTCPRCRSEFQAWVARCPDCDVALVIGSGEVVTPPPAPELPPARELACVERGDPWHLREIAEQLQQAGVSCRIDAYPPDTPIRPPARRKSAVTRFGLYVRHEDLERAGQIRNAHLERVVPDAAAPAGEAGAQLADCPACGEPLREGAASCASCGLEFPELGADE